MRRFLLKTIQLALIGTMPLQAAPWEAQSEEEALFLRRIADFWEEGEYQIVKGQIEEFLWEYPESSFAETLHATLGDLYIREKNFKGALMQYARIKDPQLAQRVFLNRMQCLLELQWFATLADECETLLQNDGLEPDQKFRATYLLAIALYQQCLNSSKSPEALEKLAKRAQPHFQTLLDSELSGEIAQAFAHLCCILKDYDSASKIYLRLASQREMNREEMLFQAALLQAEFDKPTAIQTFREILELGQSRARDALYNQTVLSFDCGDYAAILAQKDKILSFVAPERKDALHLLFGRCHLQLQQYSEALKELLLYAQNAPASEILRTALVDILEASYKMKDQPTLEQALQRFQELFPNDKQLPKGYLGNGLLLKSEAKWDEARRAFDAIRSSFADAPEMEAALFEAIELEFKQDHWEECRMLARDFLQRFPQSEQAAFAWRFLASASSRWAATETSVQRKEQLALDLESVLAPQTPLTEMERKEWSFILALTHYELHRYEEAIARIESLEGEFTQKANAQLLLALCYRDGIGEQATFCRLGEEALSQRADLLDPASLRIALYNGYLALDQVNKAAEHLFAASQLASIDPKSLLWLADYFYDQSEAGAPLAAERAVASYEQFIATAALTPKEPADEATFVKLAALCSKLGRTEKQQQILEALKAEQEAHPDWPWKERSQVDLYLAECYAHRGESDRALALFDRIVAKNPTVRTFVSASAALQSARLRLAKGSNEPLAPHHPESTKVLAQLKNLILQKTLANEPVHLEAAIEYIDLQTELEEPAARLEKRLALLGKNKAEFETADDLLSRDYQNSRKTLPEKDRIYRAYLSFLEAEIFLCRSALSQDEAERGLLKESARSLYQGILKDPATPYLKNRVEKQLESMEGR